MSQVRYPHSSIGALTSALTMMLLNLRKLETTTISMEC